MLNKIIVLSVAAVLISAFAGCSSSNSTDNLEPTSNIIETARQAGSFDTLLAAVDAAGLTETLAGPGPFTVFAPTDAAFAALPAGTVDSLLMPDNRGKLADILTYHVTGGSIDTAQVTANNSLETVFGQQINVMVGNTVMVGNDTSAATITQTDIMTGNGVIHVIDSVMIPMDIVDLASSAGSFNTLLAAVDAAGLESVLRGNGPFTVFAPTDAAFAALPEGTVASLLEPDNKDMLVRILTYHVHDRAIASTDLTGMDALEMVSGDSASVTITSGGAMIDSAAIVATDLKAINGLVHVIDEVILPPM